MQLHQAFIGIAVLAGGYPVFTVCINVAMLAEICSVMLSLGIGG